MPTQVDPRYFDFGSAFMGGMQNAQQDRRRDQMVNIDQQHLGLRQQQLAMQQDEYLRSIMAQQQQGTREDMSRAEYARLFESVGLDRGLAYTNGADELAAHIIESKLAPPEQPKLITDASGVRVPDAPGVRTQNPSQGPAPIAAEQEYNLAKRTGFQGSYLDFIKAKGKQDKPPVVADPASQLQDAQNVLAAIDTANGLIGANTTGFIGQKLGEMGGTEAYDLRAALDTVKASVGFDRLQRMREESKTGGALGQVAVRELDLLQATISSLDANQSASQLKTSLKRVRAQYQKAMAAYQKALGGESGQSGGAYADAEKERRYQEYKRKQSGG